jgi:RNA polymerase sigma-70 factor (ECF subfamily)
VRSGDVAAREALVARYLPALQRFAHGRLPARARSVLDTDDLVQDTILRALNRLDAFESEHRGSLLAYLRQILLNRVRDEARRVLHLLRSEAPSQDLPDPGPSPIEEAIGHEVLARYERALADLNADCQEAIMLRIEMGCGYEEIAEALGRSSANAARLHTKRALLKLIERLGSLQDPP